MDIGRVDGGRVIKHLLRGRTEAKVMGWTGIWTTEFSGDEMGSYRVIIECSGRYFFRAWLCCEGDVVRCGARR